MFDFFDKFKPGIKNYKLLTKRVLDAPRLPS